MNKTVQVLKYIIFDFLSAIASWWLFSIYRTTYVEHTLASVKLSLVYNTRFFTILLILPFFWLLLYYLSGYYNHIYRKSRLNELGQTFLMTLIGVIVIFFFFLLDDYVNNYTHYYTLVSCFFGLHFTITYIPRLVLTTRTNHKIQNRTIFFNTLMIGSNERALKMFQRLAGRKISSGLKFIGFINASNAGNNLLSNHLPCLGDITALKKTIVEHGISEVIIAIESNEHDMIERILNKLEGFDSITVRAIADNCDIISGRVKLDSLYDEPLIQISHELMPAWQWFIKRTLDISVSVFVLVFFSPLYAMIGIGVKLTSRGPVFYSHERIGKNGKPFNIFKFRTMIKDAEKGGPALSAGSVDPRITKLGHILRKTRLDEIPQFWNVLRGDMSIVGPRPERQFFIDQIVEKAPHYVHLHKVRPGITSWGQVKFGYAKDVDEMIERLDYDIIYIENMSIYNDLKIMIYTAKTMLLGKGI